MTWTIRLDDRAAKELRKLDRQAQSRILDYLQNRIACSDNPRQSGKALRGTLSGLWRYRVDDYRIICRIQDHDVTILILRVGHRGNIYD